MADTIQIRRSAANGTYPSLAAGEMAYSDALPEQIAVGKVGGGNDIIGTPEGTAIKSTGEAGANKYLREDGDGSCSWQTVAGASGDLSLQTQTGTAYTAVIGDSGKMITMNNAAANTVTIPANASVAFPTGTQLHFQQLGAGATTVAITSDTLDVSADLTAVLNGKWSVATAVKMSSTVWSLFGNLEPVNPALTTVGTSDIADEAVTHAKLAHIATDSILGRITAATGDVETLTSAQVATMLKPSVTTKTGAFTTTDADFGNYLVHDNVPTLHSTTDATMVGRSITFLSSGATQRTISAGTATANGNKKIDQYEAVTAICTATGATTATVWYVIGGSA